MKTSTEITNSVRILRVVHACLYDQQPSAGVLLLSTAMGLVAALIVWLVRSRVNGGARPRASGRPLSTTEGWHRGLTVGPISRATRPSHSGGEMRD